MEINCLHFECLDSTNTWAKENYKSFDPTKLTLVIADQQKAGRGRYKRQWLSSGEKNVHATFTFFLDHGRKDIGNIGQIAALSVIKTLKEFEFTGFLKWPNDIQLNRKKVGGILCETVTNENNIIVIVGIGININMPLETLEKINQPATSWVVERDEKFDIKQVLNKLQGHFAYDIDLFLKQGFQMFLEDYKKHIIHKKDDILVIDQQKGCFHSIDNDGTLIMTLANGREQKFSAGEIEQG